MMCQYAVRSSKRGGMGIFAEQDIQQGQLIWKFEENANVKKVHKQTLRDRLHNMQCADAKQLLEYLYTWEGHVWEVLDDAKFWNHSKVNANTGNHPDPSKGDGFSSYALRDIRHGEELLDDYSAYEHVAWFEDLCTEYGAVSSLALGCKLKD